MRGRLPKILAPLLVVLIILGYSLSIPVPAKAATQVLYAESWSNPYTKTFYGHYGGALDGTISATADGGSYSSGDYWWAANRYIDIGQNIYMDSSYSINFNAGGYQGTYWYYVSSDGSNWKYLGGGYANGYETDVVLNVSGGAIGQNVRYLRVRTDSGADDYFYFTIYKTNSLPNAPTVTYPLSNSSINNNTPTVSWNFSDPDTGDYQSEYQVVASNNGWQTWYYDSGIVQSGNHSVTLPQLPDGTWQFAVRTWDQNNLSSDYHSAWGYSSNVQIDTTRPTYSSYVVMNESISGFDIYLYGVYDSFSGINRVQFPTWTIYNGQDDLAPNWPNNLAVKGTDLGGGTWKFHVAASDHSNETGVYATDIYVWDNAGNVIGITGPRIDILPLPTAPSLTVTGDAPGKNSGTISFTANSADQQVTKYNVYLDGGLFKSFASTDTLSTKFSGISLGVNHSIQVAGVNTSGEGTRSTVNYYTYPKPAIPSGLYVKQANGDLGLYWSANPTGDYVLKYNIYNNGTVIGTSTTNYYSVGGMNAGTANSLQVSAVNVNAESGLSGTQDYGVLNAPTIPAGSVIGTSDGSGDSAKNAILINSSTYDLKIRNLNSSYIQFSVDGIKWSPWEIVRDSGNLVKTIRFNATNGYHVVSMRTSNSFAPDSDPSSMSGITSYYFFLDTEPPKFDLRTSNGINAALNGGIDFLIHATDNDASGLKASVIVYDSTMGIEAENDNVALTSGETQTLSVSGLPAGYHYVAVTVSDECGNIVSKELNVYST